MSTEMLSAVIFRQAALERLSTPEQLDQALLLAPSGGRFVLSLALGLLLVLLLAAAFIRTPLSVGATVLVLPSPDGPGQPLQPLQPLQLLACLPAAEPPALRAGMVLHLHTGTQRVITGRLLMQQSVTAAAMQGDHAFLPALALMRRCTPLTRQRLMLLAMQPDGPAQAARHVDHLPAKLPDQVANHLPQHVFVSGTVLHLDLVLARVRLLALLPPFDRCLPREAAS